MADRISPARLRTWHRRLALVIGLFLVFQGLTGAVSQYRFWLMGATNPAMYQVQPDGRMATPGTIVAVIERDAPDFEIAHVMYPHSNAPHTAVMAMGQSGAAPMMSGMVTFDPYADRIVYQGDLTGGWIGLANALHKWTIFGNTGRVLLTLLGLSVVALAVLGIWLHMRTRRTARRQPVMNKVHRYAGLAAGGLLLIVASTGTVLNLVTWYEKGTNQSVTALNMRAGMANATSAEPRTVTLDETYGIALDRIGPQHPIAFSPAGAHAAYDWFAFVDRQLKRTDVMVNPRSGEVVGVYPSGLVRGGDGVRGWLFSLHSGYVIGPVGGAIMTIMGLSLIFWLVSGIIMWRRGRPRNKRRDAQP